MKTFKKGKKFNLKRLVAALVVTAMLGGYIPTTLGNAVSAADLVTNKVADPNTATRPVDLFAGTTLNAGRVMVGKTVDTDRANYSSEAAGADWLVSSETNFLVTISQAAQAMGVSSEIPVPIDAVFVLDTSGSMAYDIDSTQENNVPWEEQRATHMVAAANDAIASLLAANPLNRVAVVGFSEGTTTLSTLYSYTGTAATEHLTWDGNRIVGRDTDGTTGNSRNGKSGGTNIHAGIAAGAKILAGATDPTVTINGKEVTRIPFLIVLSDGAPTFSGSSEDWTNPSRTQGPGNGSYVGNGFLPVLTASYYKEVISKHYFGDNVSDSNRAYMYTIGIGVDGLSDDDKALALITLNPKENFTSTSTNIYYNGNDGENFANYWESYQAGTADFDIVVDRERVYVGNDSGPGGRPGGGYDEEDWEWQDVTYTVTQETISSTGVTSLIYNDNYYPANDASGLEAAFRNIVVEIQKRAIAYPTLTDVDMTADYSGYVTFRDVIGEYMEVKDMKGIVADGHLFRGAQFARYMSMTREEVHADEGATAFMQDLIHSMEVRFGLRLPGETDAVHESMDKFLNDAWNWAHDWNVETGSPYEGELAGTTNPRTQMYYNSADDFDNSICWWGHTDNNGDAQLLGWAADDSIEYIEAAKQMAADGVAYVPAVGTAVAEGADYVARSYFFYGTAGGTIEQEKEYLDFSVTVMRKLEAPYTQTVVISAPASLLSMQRVLIYDTDEDGNLTAYFDEVVPARVVYEVGLRDDITAESAESILSEEYKAANKVDGGYVFYTNEWDRNATGDDPEAMTVVTFSSEMTNSYYVFDTNTPIYVKQGDTYVKYTGSEQPSGAGYYYAHEYYTWDENATAEQGAAGVTCSAVQIEYVEMNIPAPEDTTQVKWDSSQGCWVILAGTFKAQSLVSSGIEEKTQNLTGTGDHIAHPVRTGGEVDPHYTVYLGNNGKLTFATDDAKSVFNANGDDLDGLTAMVGEELTYQVTVTNTYDEPADATIVDTIPDGTELVADSVKVYKDGVAQTSGYTFTQNGDVLTWNFTEIPVGSAYTVEFKVKVTEEALDISVVSNQATITLGDNTYKSNLVTNPIEGKKASGATSTVVPADGVQIGDQIVYTIQYHNDTASTSDVKIVDEIPAGTQYVDGSATNGGTLTNGVLNWTIQNVAPGTGGSVSFKVEVTAAALTVNPFTNTATIQIGTNAPEQSTNEVEIEVKIGDLVLSKVVETLDDDGLNPKADQEFVLVLTETSGLLKDAEEEFALVDASGNAIKDSDNNDIKVKFDANSQAKVTIKAGQTLTVKGLPVGVTIVVTEEPVAGYTPSYVPNNSAVIVENDTTTPAVSVEVTNTYAPDSTDDLWKLDYINFYKNLVSNGAPLSNKTFNFVAHPANADGTLSHERSSVIRGTVTVNSGTDVKIEFDELRFTKTGTYYFLIDETVGSDAGITYDITEFLLKVEVFDDGSGKLQIKEDSIALQTRPDVNGEWTDATKADAVFTNVYTPASATVDLAASKVLNNRDLSAIDFEFTFEVVDADGNVVVIARNDENGNITFPEFAIDNVGEYTYTIREVNGGHHGYTYDTEEFTVTVKVTDDGQGQLDAEVVYPTGGVVFENTYTPDPISVVLEASKVLTGRALVAGEFEFRLVGTDGTDLTAKNDAAGKIIFPEIKYDLTDAGKTYTYTISEVKGTDGQIVYSSETITVTVGVTYDQVNGVLSATTSYPADTEIENTFNPPAISVTPQGVKITENKMEGDETFTFNVVEVDGTIVATGTSKLNGTISFTADKLEFTQVGTYYYWIQEIPGDAGGITYDDVVYVMKITVTADATTGLLSSATEYGVVSAVGETAYTTAYGEAVFINRYDAADGRLVILVDKILEGRDFDSDDRFGFILKDKDENQVDIAYADIGAGGLVVFDEIVYNAVGTYTYTITEVDAGKEIDGVTYDSAVYTVVVTVTDDQNGQLHATVTDVQKDGEDVSSNTIVFTNKYAPASTTITLGAEGTVDITKVLNGRPMVDGEFSFLLQQVGGTHTDTKTNQSGKVVFDAITYTSAGTYIYTIKEIAGTVPGVTYNTTEYTVTVTVTDDLDGHLVATVTDVQKDGVDVEDNTTVQFVNTYKATETSIKIEATKLWTVLNGDRELKAGDFDFVLQDENGHRMVVTNDADGKIIFENDAMLTFTEAGDYTYTVYEVKESLGGVTYDDESKTKYEVVVSVIDNTETGKLEASISSVKKNDAEVSDKKIVFNNQYTAAPTSLRLTAKKYLPERPLVAEEFRFEAQEVLADGQLGEVKALGWNDADGNVIFNAITFDKIGEYTFKVYEAHGDRGGVTYDENYYMVVIKVEDGEDGHLKATVESITDKDGKDAATMEFKNTYAPADTSITLGTEGTLDIIKNLTGRDIVAGEFEFILTGTDLANALTAKNDANGKIVFPEITYTKTGTYTYTISEVEGSLGGVTYNKDIYTVTVTVTDNLQGQLVAEVTEVRKNGTALEGEDPKAEFNNTYKPEETTIQLGADKTLDIIKNLTGRDIVAGEFEFILKALDSVKEDLTAKNDVDGKIIFPEITYTEVGTYTYEISEVKGEAGGVGYTGDKYVVTVTVTDNLEGQLVAEVTEVKKDGTKLEGEVPTVEFNNTYTPNPTYIQLEADKALEVLAGTTTLEGGQFSFYLAEQLASGGYLLIENRTNNAAGNVVFSAIEYTEAGVHTYAIGENRGTNSGVTYDSRWYEVVVTVEDDGEGTLTAAITGITLVKGEERTSLAVDAAVEFVNIYKAAPTTVEIQASKDLTGKDIEADEFSFLLESVGDVFEDMIVKNDADGKIVFPVEFAEAGTYEFLLTEQAGTDGHVTYDGNEFKITVKVTDDGLGQLHAHVEYGTTNNQQPVFSNTYTPDPIKVEIEGTKKLTGKTLTDGLFIFQLLEGGTEVATGTNTADGNFVIELEIGEPGEYLYEVVEMDTKAGGMTYDTSSWTVKVTVTAKSSGELEAAVEYIDGDIVFENSYDPQDCPVVITALKSLIGKELVKDAYEFEITEYNAETGKYEVRATAKNAADGTITFSEIVLDKTGTYHYVVSEVQGDEPGVAYDQTKYNIRVDVRDEDGVLKYEVTYTDGALVFNNTYNANSVDVEIEATKELTGKKLTDGEFTFRLTDALGNDVVAPVTNDAAGNIKFRVNVEKAGTYHWTISEVAGKDDHITYDGHEYKVTVEVTDDGSGQLKAKVTYETADDKAPVFENEYTPDPVKVEIEGTKTLTSSLTDKEMTDGLFIFEVMDGDQVVGSGKNTADGKFVIELEFAEPGEYRYTLVEKDLNAPGMIYDKTEINVAIDVTAADSGELSAKVIYSNVPQGRDVGFENEYEPAQMPIKLGGLKTMTGKELGTDKYIFVLEELVNGQYVEVSRATNDKNGQIAFADINDKKVGTYYYRISEVAGISAGVSYDSTMYHVEVTVMDIGGELKYDVKYVDGAVVFNNTYKASPVTVTIDAWKELVGKDLEAGEFTFVLQDEHGNNVASPVTNHSDGSIAFKVELTEAGTYRWTIAEKADGKDYITYDDQVYEVVVEVTDDIAFGRLLATVEYDTKDGKAPVFKNTYTSDPVTVDLTLEGMIKNLIGRGMVEGEFVFEVKDSSGKMVSTGKNDADGNIVFDKKLEFTEAGDYTFTVYEVAGDDDNITYDETVYTMNVTVTDGGKGTLTAAVTYGADGKGEVPAFENTHTPDAIGVVLEALKELVGRDLKDGEFTFEVKDSAGNVVATGKNDADGKILFSEIKLSAGEYTYTVYEVIGEAEDTIYDDSEFAVTVVVTDEDNDGVLEQEITYPEDGVKFVNENYTEVDTGDNSQTILWIAVAALCVVTVGTVLVIRKKFR